ncbi:unnamed protein product [Ranitomeya imitator]|uniref:G-protein coupled receptors family 3 profile domain-containing protein n=1 Tax=Ranitomeya imitator TaxID=111125 RepID=A0ABN9MNJ2_9NEOB|nr:unnamed protein product [Ranitomeya imitator]
MLREYLADHTNVLRDSSVPFNYWVSKLDTWHELTLYTLEVLACPAASVLSEQVFIAAGGIITDKRIRLSTENADRLTLIKMNKGWIGKDFCTPPKSENCQRCPDHEWPNKEKNKCVFRDYEFVSYETDVLASVFSIISILLSFITVLVIGIFTLFLKSPIVRANNRNLSFILLISLLFSVLCVFLFIGCPLDITCMLRQVFFGILFTVAESSILAKTIIVCIAFKATRPGSPWRKCVGVRLPYSVVLVCSSLQIGNAVIWLSVSPPYQEFNLDYPGKIIIQCNEGSLLAFSFMLGYMGFLAAVSFFLAFMVRTLPDIYNEAKYITFSMLVFCSVWICAIPAYLSSTGKHMRIQFKLLILIYKAIHNLSPTYISELISLYLISCNLRSSQDLLLSSTLILSSPNHLQDFSRISPILWNSVPQHRLSTIFGSFRQNLKTHLFKKAYGLQ